MDAPNRLIGRQQEILANMRRRGRKPSLPNVNPHQRQVGPAYYIYARNVVHPNSGKLVDVLRGPEPTPEAAMALGRGLEADWKIIDDLPWDKGEANQIMRARRQDEHGLNFSESIANIRHKGKDLGF